MLTAIVALYAVVLVRHAWVSDDAYITFRSVRNFIEGHGPTWNIGTRVQVYTHPLWMFLLSAVYALTREIHVSSIILSIAVSTAAVSLAVSRLAGGAAGALVLGAALVSSRSFMDFSTSGLENPLTHLLVAALIALHVAPVADEPRASARRYLGVCLCVCALTLNRLDSLLLGLPVLVVWGLKVRRLSAVARALVIGFSPLVVWELFSLVYYGFPFPNTAYAKLGSSISAFRLASRGVGYCVTSIDQDPLTMALLVAALVGPFLARDRRLYPLAIGIALYVAYVVRIGGDFMMGRFFSAPCFIAAIVSARLVDGLVAGRAYAFVPGIVTLALGAVITARPPLSSDARYDRPQPAVDERGITEERGYYYPSTGLLRWAPGRSMMAEEIARYGRKTAPGSVVVWVAVGQSAYAAPRETIVVDSFGIVDPLVARMPRLPSEWRPGHILRLVPPGYLESLKLKKNVITDKPVAALYDKLMAVTQGPLFTKARWRAIGDLNLGRGGL